MRLKTLLLGSATAFAVAGGAQAADLSVAEPVDYVRVCDAFGTGYWYIPGTDTCLKIGGWVRMDIQFAEESGDGIWDMTTSLYLTATAQSMTDYGPLKAYLAIEADNKNGAFGSSAYMDEAYLSIGPALLGFTWSAYNPVFFLIDGMFGYTGNTELNLIQVSWAMNGFGLTLAIEDPLARLDYYYGTGYSGYFPDIVAALDATWGNIGVHAGFGFGDRFWGNSWGANLRVKIGLDSMGAGDALTLGALYSGNGSEWINGMPYYAGLYSHDYGYKDYWGVYVDLKHNWTAMVSSEIFFGYNANQRTGSYDYQNTKFGFNTTYAPVPGFSIAGEIIAEKQQNYTMWSNNYDVTGRVRVWRGF